MMAVSLCAISRLIPQWLRRVTKVATLDALDAWDSLRGRRDPLVPPRRLIFVGGGDYKRIGDRFLKHFIYPGELRPSDVVVDVGCGCGRLARPLTEYLNPSLGGRYHGIDIVEPGIAWCKKYITPRFTHFQFTHLDIYNKAYNPTGRGRAQECIFPMMSKSVDFIVAVSLLTSMYPADAAHYIEEMARVLKPGGRLFLSLFLLNEESMRLLNEGKSGIPFVFAISGGLAANADFPEAAVACDEQLVLNWLKKAGMSIEEPIHYGRWVGRAGPTLTHEDVIVAVRNETPIQIGPISVTGP
jgi:SAM-dependent methyltransferase